MGRFISRSSALRKLLASSPRKSLRALLATLDRIFVGDNNAAGVLSVLSAGFAGTAAEGAASSDAIPCCGNCDVAADAGLLLGSMPIHKALAN